MRHGRAKAARKTLAFFARQGCKAPFSVVLDGTFLVQCVVYKIPVHERMSKILQHSSYTVYVTRSSLDELDLLAKHAPKEKRNAIVQARQWGLDECETIESRDIPKDLQVEIEQELGLPGKDVCKLVESRAHSYIVATQDETLLHVLRNVQAVSCPLLRLSRSVLLLENPSKAAQQYVQHVERLKYAQSSAAVHKSEFLLAKTVRDEERQSNTTSTQQQQHFTRMKRKAKGPNPLSCKKKKATTSNESQHKRKRRRKTKSSEAAQEAS